ncbi:MAG: sigma-70 family RNA polymerase sigma factor [Hyphomicrobiaceae bacterium]
MRRRDAIAAEIPRLRRYARALTGDESEAEDLVQDCLERAISRIAQWRDDESPRKWLLAILHNLHVDGVRRRARRPLHVDLDKAEHVAAAPGSDSGSGRDLEAALRSLPGEQLQVVLLVGLEGLSYAEAADVAGVPVGTVMSRLSRGRDRLRQLLGDGGDRQGGRTSPLRRIK